MSTTRIRQTRPDVLREQLEHLGVDVEGVTKKVDLVELAKEHGIDDETINREFPVEVDPTKMTHEERAEARQERFDNMAKLEKEDESYEELTEAFDAGEKLETKKPAEPIVDDVPARVLIRMTRANPTFQTHGHKFTQASPFAVLDEDTAQHIMDVHEGFRMATPREAKEFYS